MLRTLAVALLLVVTWGRAVGADDEGATLASVRLTQEAILVPGRATALSIALVLGPGLRLLDDAPLLLRLDGTALAPARRVLRRRDAVDPRAEQPRFEVEVRAERGGAPALTARLEAWVCRGRSCRPIETTTSLPLTLAAAGPR